MRPSYRPHYASCPSVCPSVCPVRAFNSKTKRRRTVKIDMNVSQGTSKWSAILSCKDQIQGHWTSKTSRNCRISDRCLLTGGRSSAGGSDADCELDLTIVRPNLLSTPETLGSWTAGRVSCRHSALTYFLV